MKRLDPKNDIVFKKIFRQNKNLLISLLNDLLMRPSDQQITHIDYLDSEQLPDLIEGKRSVVDVKCLDQQNRTFIVEMQMIWTNNFKKRILFTGCTAIVSQLHKGDDYSLLNQVYSLSLLNQNFLPDSEQFYHRYSVTKQGDPAETIPGLELVMIELPKYLKHPN